MVAGTHFNRCVEDFSHDLPDSVYVYSPANFQLRLYRNYFSSYELLHQFSAGTRLDDLSFASRSKVIAVTYGDSMTIIGLKSRRTHFYACWNPIMLTGFITLNFNSLKDNLYTKASKNIFSLQLLMAV
ncbi:MAG: hypothetical protein IPJ75_15755 [Ignavibacteriales bacterium]|nr:hypothetical protein [Ignavibacteriales bacterium]